MYLIELKEIILLIAGALLGAISSFIIGAYFSDHFHLPFLHSRHRLFPPGKYLYFAPSRGGPVPVVKWDFVVRKRRWFRGSHVTMDTSWTDGTGQRHVWCYEGPIVRKGDLTVARLNVCRFREHTVAGDEGRAAAPNRDDDPCFVVFHNDTENWGIRPGITAGFSESNSCYGGVHILKNQDSPITDQQVMALFDSDYFLDYAAFRSRIYDAMHAPLRKPGVTGRA